MKPATDTCINLSQIVVALTLQGSSPIRIDDGMMRALLLLAAAGAQIENASLRAGGDHFLLAQVRRALGSPATPRALASALVDDRFAYLRDAADYRFAAEDGAGVGAAFAPGPLLVAAGGERGPASAVSCQTHLIDAALSRGGSISSMLLPRRASRKQHR